MSSDRPTSPTRNIRLSTESSTFRIQKLDMSSGRPPSPTRNIRLSMSRKVDRKARQQAGVASKLEVKAMPTFVLMKDEEVLNKIVGANPEEIKKMLDAYVQSSGSSRMV